jgi:hypothetical protein
MGLFKKKSDPIAERERALKQELAAVEGQIKQLHAGLAHAKHQPRLRSTVVPHSIETTPGPSPVREPVFETVDQRRIQSPSEPESTPGHYNEHGVRKYDLVAAWRRLQNLFRGGHANNPKLVSLLAAGNIQGLRPLHYEKRVARNRFIVLVLIFLGLLYGILTVFFQGR